jgi:hypothetical protein
MNKFICCIIIIIIIINMQDKSMDFYDQYLFEQRIRLV